MPDIETSVVISAQTDQLQSGLEAASNSVQAATDAMRAQFAGLGTAAQQAQSQVNTAAAQVGSSIGALQSKAAGLAGSVGDAMISNSVFGNARSQEIVQSNAALSGRAGTGSGSLQVWRAQLQEQLLAEHSFFGQSKD